MSTTENVEPDGNRSSDQLDYQAAANRALPEPDLGQVSHDVVENWWAAPISNRLTAAFHVGRLLNQLNWHFQNILFFVSLDDKKMAAEVLNRLAVVSNRLVCHSTNQLEGAIIETRERVDGWLHSEAAADEVAACCVDYQQQADVNALTNRLRELTGVWVIPLIDRLRDSFWGELSEAEKTALRLGQCLDKGIRCSDRYLFIEPEQNFRSGWYRNEQRRGSPNFVSTGYVCHPYQPGDLEPEPAWFGTLKELLAMTGVPVDQSAAILTAWQNEKPQNHGCVPRMVEQLDSCVRNHLGQCNGDSDSPRSFDCDVPIDGRERCQNLTADKSISTSSQVFAGLNEIDYSETAHSDDFRSLSWFGVTYSFTSTQAPIVKLLYQNGKKKTPDVGDETLLSAVDSEAPPARLRDVFRGCKAWNAIIVRGGTRGTHRLAKPS